MRALLELDTAACGSADGQPALSRDQLSMSDRTVLPSRLAVPWRLVLAAALLVVLLLGAMRSEGLASESGPLVQQGAKLIGGEEGGEGRFGRSVALSADGNTALIGGPRDGSEAGAVWVFTRSGSTWTQQAKLTGGGESGEGHFGRSLAISADGNTALIGGPNDDGVGAAWVFTRSGSTWTQQGEKLTGDGESGSGWFGQSVALSANGDTALIGGFVDHSDTGAAWVFTRSGSTWSQQSEKLTGGGESPGGQFGWSVALSADGETALIGGHEDDGGVGAAWVFARSGSTWSQLGEKLTGGGESGNGELGWSVALSSAGTTALVGGLGDHDKAGAAWVFVDPPPASDVPSRTETSSTVKAPPTTATSTPVVTTVSAGQGVAAFRAGAGRVSLAGATVIVRSNWRAMVKLRCVAVLPCRGRLTLTVRVKSPGKRPRAKTIGMVSFSIPPARATVKLRLRTAGRSLLRTARGRLRATLRILKSSPGSRQTQTDTVHLVLQRAHRSAQRKQ